MARVSIIIPCYNRADLLRETLDSVRAQSFPDWEAIIVDDGSTDSSPVVAGEFEQRDSRFRALRREGARKGANSCRNQGLAASQSNFVIFLDSDDLLASTCLEMRLAAMDRAPNCGFGVFQTEVFSQKIGDRAALWNVFTRTDDLNRFLSKDSVWHTTGPIWRRSVLLQLHGFDEDLLSFHDWDLHVRALIARIPYFKKPIRDFFYRNGIAHSDAISAVSCSSQEHLRSHERMFTKTIDRLRDASLFNAETRLRLGGLFWWLAVRWLRIDPPDPIEARRVWSRAFELGLVPKRNQREGLFLLALHHWPGAGRLTTFVQKLWPTQLYQTGSAFFLVSNENTSR